MKFSPTCQADGMFRLRTPIPNMLLDPIQSWDVQGGGIINEIIILEEPRCLQ